MIPNGKYLRHGKEDEAVEGFTGIAVADYVLWLFCKYLGSEILSLRTKA